MPTCLTLSLTCFFSKLNLSGLYQVIARLLFTLTFKSVDEILPCYHSNDTSFAELSYRNIYFLRFYKTKFERFGKYFNVGVKVSYWL